MPGPTARGKRGKMLTSWPRLSIILWCRSTPSRRETFSGPHWGDTEPCGHPYQIGERGSLHLPHHLPSVRLDGDLADAELGADLLVQQPGNYKRHHFALARAQGQVAFPQRPCLCLVAKRSAAAIDGLPNGAEQHIVLERLRQDLDGSGPHRPDGHRDVAVASDEDDRAVDPLDGDSFLEVETAEVGKVNVENEAARSQDSRVGKKLASGAEGFGPPTLRADQQFQRLAHRDVVVDDEDDGRRLGRRTASRSGA